MRYWRLSSFKRYCKRWNWSIYNFWRRINLSLMIRMTSSAEYAPAYLRGFSISESTESSSESSSPRQVFSTVMDSLSSSSEPKSKVLWGGGVGIRLGWDPISEKNWGSENLIESQMTWRRSNTINCIKGSCLKQKILDHSKLGNPRRLSNS